MLARPDLFVRRTLLLSMTVAVLLFSAACEAAEEQANNAAPRPNIIYVLVDDMGYGDLGITGQKNFTTPHLDAMAAKGMFFTHSYSGSTVCAPSRATLMSGMHTGHAYQRGNGGPITFRKDPKDITVGTLLQKAGYTTAMFGKSGLSCNTDDGGHVLEKGFDYFYGLTSHRACHRHYPEKIWRNDQKETLPGNKGYTGEHYFSEVCMADALRWIRENGHGDKPFFAHIALTPPHADIVVPEAYRAPFMGRFDEVPNRGGYYKQQHPKATYAGMINFIDQKVGELIKDLHEQGIAENTIVFFASDNGPTSVGGILPEHHNSNAHLRGSKRDLYEGGIRTPLLVYWPGTIRAGSTSDHPNAMWDFLPTALDLAGAPIPQWTDGLSIVPSLMGQHDQQQRHTYLYWEFYERGGKQAVRWGKWKGVRLNVREDRNAPIELYNLETDESETTDIAGKHPEVVKQIAAFMEEAHSPSPIFSWEHGFMASMLDAPADRYLPNTKMISKSDWKVVDASSESVHNNKLAANAIDGDPRNWWHTEWRDAKPGHPHHITFDIVQAQPIKGLRYLPRQDGNENGRIKDYAVYVSQDGRFGQPVATGQFKNNAKEQEVVFDRPVKGRFVKLVAISAFNDQPFTAVGELGLIAGD